MELLIRQACVEDGRSVAAIYEPYVTETPASFEEIAPTGEEMAGRIRETIERFPFLVAEDGGQVIGYAYAGLHGTRASYRWSVNVSAYIARTHHRRGIGTLLYQELFSQLQAQGYAMAYAGITLPNAASVGLHESLGFTRVGVYCNAGYKLGSWRDVGWWERRLIHVMEAHPAEPTPWPLMPAFEAKIKKKD
jgi:L-amino acid N-acyltransferase YncA